MSRSNRQKREPISDRKHVLTFGKYQGDTIDDVLLDDPGYLVWLHNNTDFELNDVLLDAAEALPQHTFSGYSKRDEEWWALYGDIEPLN